MSRPLSLTLAVLCGALALAACAPHKGSGGGTTTNPTSDPESQTLADDGTDTSASEGDALSLTGTLLSSSGSSVGLAGEQGSGLMLDNVVGNGARLFFLPVGCLTVENPTTSSVRYTFAGCAGPRGLRSLSGVIDVSYASANGALTLDITSKGLQVNKATLDWTAKATITASGAMRTMDWAGHFTGTTGGGRAITRDNTKVMTWTVGDSCFEINGTSEGTVGTRDVKTELISYQRCKASCPEAGSEIKVTHVSAGKVVDLVYGTGEATFTDAAGDKITFVPLCAK